MSRRAHEHCRAIGLLAAAACAVACGGKAPPPPEPPVAEEPVEDAGPPAAWKIFYSTETETLEDDGVTVGISATATTIRLDNVPDAVAEEIASLLPEIEAADATYRLTSQITGAGMNLEILSVDYGDSSFDLRFEQGPQHELPPEPVARLYELVARKPLPSTLEEHE